MIYISSLDKVVYATTAKNGKGLQISNQYLQSTNGAVPTNTIKINYNNVAKNQGYLTWKNSAGNSCRNVMQGSYGVTSSTYSYSNTQEKTVADTTEVDITVTKTSSITKSRPTPLVLTFSTALTGSKQFTIGNNSLSTQPILRTGVSGDAFFDRYTTSFRGYNPLISIESSTFTSNNFTYSVPNSALLMSYDMTNRYTTGAAFYTNKAFSGYLGTGLFYFETSRTYISYANTISFNTANSVSFIYTFQTQDGTRTKTVTSESSIFNIFTVGIGIIKGTATSFENGKSVAKGYVTTVGSVSSRLSYTYNNGNFTFSVSAHQVTRTTYYGMSTNTQRTSTNTTITNTVTDAFTSSKSTTYNYSSKSTSTSKSSTSIY